MNLKNVEEVAEELYETYCKAVGGVSYMGDPLPRWKSFSIDPAKKVQADAWREAAASVRAHLILKTPHIVCLCGSTRFYKEFQVANYEETMKGNIVLSVGFYPHAVNEMHGEGVGITPEQKEALDELHKRKIDLCDEVLVLNVGGYIGDSTRSEIEYAKKRKVAIRYLESV